MGPCRGIQCEETRSSPVTYNPEFADGEDRFSLEVSGMGKAKAEATIKVDGTPPHDLKVSGLGAKNELSDGPHQIKVEASDGTQPTKSSGMHSLAISMNSRQP